MPRFGILAAALLAIAGRAYAVGGLVDVSVYDRTHNRELPVYYHEGKYYVPGKPGNEYQISLRNQSGASVLNVVSVDGVDVIHGKTANWHHGGYVLSPWEGMEIRGWRKSMHRVARFYFTRLPDSYAARTGRPENVGVIGVAVFNEKPRYQPVPEPYPYEYRDYDAPKRAPSAPSSGALERPAETQAPALQRGDAAAKDEASSARGKLAEPGRLYSPERERQPESKLGTGHGRSESSRVRHVEFERASATPDEVITIYYDSYRNLVARGVIPADTYAEPYDPTPFPGQFVPDPGPRY